MSGAQSKVVHFVVTGEAMTQTARDLLLDEDPGKAYRLLAEGLRGEGAIEAALRVLAGTHDLVGDSHVGLELVEAEDTPELRRFKKDFQFIYAGRFRTKQGWRRPVAQIVCWLPEDGTWATERMGGDQGFAGTDDGIARMHRWTAERARYYCSADETVLIEFLRVDGKKTCVIWEFCSELPHWMKPADTLQAALDEALAAGRTLEDRPSQTEIELSNRASEERSKQRLTRKKRDEDAEEEERERERQQRLQQIGDKVRAQAGDDTFSLELKDGRMLTIARAPFVRWALHRTDQWPRAPRWENVAPSGLKMALDNPDHTDWVLGAGLTLEEAYKDAVSSVAWDKAFEFQEEARGPREPYAGIRAAMEMLHDTIHEAATVVDAGVRTGTVGFDVAVFPDSEASRVDQIADCIAVIIEKGGKLAHFAIVTKGRGITVMRHPDACTLFEDGTRVTLNPKTGRIVILDETD